MRQLLFVLIIFLILVFVISIISKKTLVEPFLNFGKGLRKAIKRAKKRNREMERRKEQNSMQQALLTKLSKPPVDPTMVAEYEKKLKEMDDVNIHLQTQEQALKHYIEENHDESRTLKNDIDVYYDKIMCEKAHVYEQMNLKDISKASFEGNDLHISRSFTHGVWDDEKAECQKPVYDNSKCSSFVAECGYHGTHETYMVNGRDHPTDPKSCVFPYCPVYCEKYVGDCWDVVLNESEQFEFRSNMGRTNCVNRDDSTSIECKELDPKHCPQAMEYYYHTDNMTILSNVKVPSIENNICVYNSTAPYGTLTFDTYQDAENQCKNKSITKECYTHNSEYDTFQLQKYDLNRATCGYDNYDSEVCRPLGQLKCQTTNTLYAPGVGTYNPQGFYEFSYVKKEIPKVLEKDGVDYKCVPSTGDFSELYSLKNIDESCSHDRCYSHDGSDVRVAIGSVDQGVMKCAVEDCFAESQKLFVQDCAERSFFYISDQTIIQSNYNVEIVDNKCTYNTGYKGDIYDSYAEAEATCVGMDETSTCFQNIAPDVYRETTVTLNRNICEYPYPTGCLSEEEVTQQTCSSFSPMYHFGPKKYENSNMTFEIKTVENRHVQIKEGDTYTCIEQTSLPPNHFASTEGVCSNLCYTLDSPETTVMKSGLIESGFCTIRDCFENPIISPPPAPTEEEEPRPSEDTTVPPSPTQQAVPPSPVQQAVPPSPIQQAVPPSPTEEDVSEEIEEVIIPASSLREWNPASKTYKVTDARTKQVHYESVDGESLQYNPITTLLETTDPVTQKVTYMNPKNGDVYDLDTATNTYTFDNPNNLSTHTITSTGTKYYSTVHGQVNVDPEGRMMYVDPETKSTYYSNPISGLVTFQNSNTGEVVYVDPITRSKGILRSDGHVVFENSAGDNYYVNIHTGIVTKTIQLENMNQIFDQMD
jgi:hypothetical protein